jgi:putative tricarboxylic transport membrane protein
MKQYQQLLGKVCLLTSAFCLIAAAPAAAQEWKPSRNVDIVVNSGAGGAADRQSRTVQKFLQSVPGIPSVTVTNKPGGGGSISMQYLVQQPGDAHYLGVLSTALVTNHIVGVSKISYRDLTPLNILMHDYIAVWVRKDSPIASGKDLVARLRKDPKSVSLAFSTAPGNQNHVLIGMLARAAGVDPKALKTVIFASGGQGIAAALGGHVDVWFSTAAGAVQQVDAGAVRVLGMSSHKRQPGKLASVPTFAEQGIDASYHAWRGFLAPPGMTAAQVAYWDQTFAKVVREPEWKKVTEEFLWGADFKNSAQTRAFLDSETELLQKILLELGVISRNPAS